MTAAGTWARGDYPAVAVLFEPAAAELVRAVGVAGRPVLDVAAGTGNVAVAALAAGAAAVTLVDACPPLLAHARRRLAGTPAGRATAVPTAGSGAGPGGVATGEVPVGIAVGDCQRLPVATGGAARVLSCFGVVYADDPAAAARELVRACAPGGRIALTAFTPGAAPGCFRSVLTALLDEPVPARSAAVPAHWADPDRLRGFFAGTGADLLAVTDHTLPLRFADPAAAADFFATRSGPILEVREHLEAAGRWPAAERALRDAFARAAHADGGSITVPAPYRLAVVAAPGGVA